MNPIFANRSKVAFEYVERDALAKATSAGVSLPVPETSMKPDVALGNDFAAGMAYMGALRTKCETAIRQRELEVKADDEVGGKRARLL